MREQPSQRVLRVSRKIILSDFGRPNWTQQFAERLPLQWPSEDRADLEHLAGALPAEDRWKSMEPTDAAVQSLRHGIHNVPRAESSVD